VGDHQIELHGANRGPVFSEKTCLCGGANTIASSSPDHYKRGKKKNPKSAAEEADARGGATNVCPLTSRLEKKKGRGSNKSRESKVGGGFKNGVGYACPSRAHRAGAIVAKPEPQPSDEV